MNVEFKGPEAEEEITEHIVIGGLTLGKMITYKGRILGSPYHAIFCVEKNPCTLLIQGHGKTREDAIKNALISGRADAAAISEAVKELEAKLFGEKSPHKPPRHPKDNPQG